MTVKPLAQTPRLSHRSAVFAVQLFSLFLLCTSARGEVIVDIEDGGQGEYAINNAVSVEEGWFSPIGYSNVSIAPWLVNDSQSPQELSRDYGKAQAR